MPLTLEKLFSKTATVSFPYEDETVHVTWAPARYTGVMQDRADEIQGQIAESQEEIGVIVDRARIAEEAMAAMADVPGPDGKPVASPEKVAVAVAAADLRAQADRAEFSLSRKSWAGLRETLAKLLVTWDVLGEDGKPIPTDEETLRGLPDGFLMLVFLSLTNENQLDPQKAPTSEPPSVTAKAKASAPSPTGTATSKPRGRSASVPSSSTNGQNGLGTIQSGAPGA